MLHRTRLTIYQNLQAVSAAELRAVFSQIYPALRLALDKIWRSRTERISISLTSSLSSCERNKYGGIWFNMKTKRKENSSSINHTAIEERAYLEEFDPSSPYRATSYATCRHDLLLMKKGRKPLESGWDRMNLSLHSMIVERGGVIDDHFASLTPQVEHQRFFPRWSPTNSSELYLHYYDNTALQKRRKDELITVFSYQDTIATLIYIITFIQCSKMGQINLSLISKHDHRNTINQRLT